MPETNEFPSSGDLLIDWHFKQLIEPLLKETVIVRKKKPLFDPNDPPPRKAVRGLYVPRDNEPDIIYLNSSKSVHTNWKEYVETLIHELSHNIHTKAEETDIKELEEILTLKFTDDQKKYLKQFIPKKPVKLDPPAEKETETKNKPRTPTLY